MTHAEVMDDFFVSPIQLENLFSPMVSNEVSCEHLVDAKWQNQHHIAGRHEGGPGRD